MEHDAMNMGFWKIPSQEIPVQKSPTGQFPPGELPPRKSPNLDFPSQKLRREALWKGILERENPVMEISLVLQKRACMGKDIC